MGDIVGDIATTQLVEKYKAISEGAVKVSISTWGNVLVDLDGKTYRVTYSGVPINKSAELKKPQTPHSYYEMMKKGLCDDDVFDLLVTMARKV